MTKYILAGGYVRKAPDGGKAFCEELIKDIDLYRPIKILYCVFADPNNAEMKFLEDKEFLSKFIPNIELTFAHEDKFIDQVKDSDVIFLKGGETDILLDTLHKCEEWVNELEGKVVAGTSAGAMALVKYSHALERNVLIEGLGILDLKIIAHWKSDIYEVDWESALRNLKNYKEDLPVYTLAEGEFKVIVK